MNVNAWNDDEWGSPGGGVDDRDDPQECDLSDDLDDLDYDTTPCPACGREFSELAEQCPYCGEWVTRRQRLGGGRRTWVVILAILLLISMLAWIL